jgi:hypothetical protein
MSKATPTTRDLLERMLAKVEEMRHALDAADSVSAGVDGARAREALDDLERRVRAMMQETQETL